MTTVYMRSCKESRRHTAAVHEVADRKRDYHPLARKSNPDICRSGYSHAGRNGMDILSEGDSPWIPRPISFNCSARTARSDNVVQALQQAQRVYGEAFTKERADGTFKKMPHLIYSLAR